MKIIRILVKIIATFILLLGIVAYFSISYIDTTPYFETDYYKTTIKRIHQVANNMDSTEGNLSAGFARINITPLITTGAQHPEQGIFKAIKIAGFGDGQLATDIHDSLFAKAIAIKVNQKLQIFISGDLLMMPPKVVKKVSDEIVKRKDIQRHQLLFGATHTHSSLGNYLDGFIGKQFTGDYQTDVVDWLSEKLTTLIINAVDDIKPAEMASTSFKATPFIANRIIGETGRLNDKLTLLAINQENGGKAIIGIFAAHPTVISSWNSEFSGDYPGAFQRNLENSGIELAMFFGGTLGSHTNRGVGEKFDKTEYIGKALADSSLKAIASLEYKKHVQLTRIHSKIELPKLQIIPINSKLRLSPWLGKQLLSPVENVYLQSIKLDNLIWISLPCELSGEYAIDLKNALELKGYQSAFTSFNGEYLGYVVPSKYYYYDTYESRLMGWYGPSFGDYLMELNFLMANKLLNEKL